MYGYNPVLDETPLSEFDEISKKILETKNKDFIGFHQGKTYFSTRASLSPWSFEEFGLEAFQHAPPGGIFSLRSALATRLTSALNKEVSAEDLLITCGATNGIEISLRAILRPGDDVLILSPQWLFVVGLVHAAHGNPIEVPIFLDLSDNRNFDYLTPIRKAITPNTRAIYFNNPNNPTGYHLSREQLISLLELAKEHKLWVLSDNAYENYDYTLEGFIDPVSLQPEYSEFVFSIYTFSKTYTMPGYRVGYMIPPKKMYERVKKMSLYSIYSMPTPSQYGAFMALKTPSRILEDYRNLAIDSKDILMEQLKIPFTYVDGGFYTFLHLSQCFNGNTNMFLNECIKNGVSLAPGIAFGTRFAKYARLCFTTVQPSQLKLGIEILNRVYENSL